MGRLTAWHKAIEMKIILSLSALALVLSACAAANQPPAAYIDSISPVSPQQCEAVLLEGHGVDADGQVAGCGWRSSIDGALGNSSCINTSALSAGEHVIYFRVCDDDGAWSPEVSTTLSVSPRPTAVSQQAAAAMVVNEVIEPLDVDGPLIAVRLEDSLKPGDTVAPYDGKGQQIDEESYFFFIDLLPWAYYSHDVLFVLVSREDGDINVSAEQWWPMVNDELPDFLGDEDGYWNVSHWIYSRDIAPPVFTHTDPSQIGQPPSQQQWHEASLIVNGHADGEVLGADAALSAWIMWELFDSLITPDNTFSITPPPIGSNTPMDVLAQLEELCDEGYDHITVYMIGHGGEDRIKLGGIAMSATMLANFVGTHPETSFSFLLESCHIGSFIDDLRAQPNVHLVLTATSALFSATGDFDPEYDPNPEDGGSEWTSSLYFGALDRLSDGGWEAICSEASTMSLPPSVVLLLAAFNNEDDVDSLALDAAYLGNHEFPQASSPWGVVCDLWQYPPVAGEGRIYVSPNVSGYVTEGGSVWGYDGYLYAGQNDSRRAFFSFELPADIPAGSTLLRGYMRVTYHHTSGCEPGDLGTLVIEHLDYGELHGDDFGAAADAVVSDVPLSSTHCVYTFPPCSYPSIRPWLQDGLDSGQQYSQYRASFDGPARISVTSAAVYYYEVR